MILVAAVPAVAAYLGFSLLGICGNFAIIAVTVKHKRLQGPCNVLIALNSFGEILHQVSHLIQAYYIFSGINFIPLVQCFYIQLIFNIGMNFSICLTLMIGIDRLLSVVCPIRYSSLNRPVYLSVLTVGPIAYSASLVYYAYICLVDNTEKVCIIAAIYHGPSRTCWIVSGCVVHLAVILVYGTIIVYIKGRTGKLHKRRLFKSLTIISTFIVSGWFLTMVLFGIATLFEADETITYLATVYAGIFANFSFASNYFVHYNCSGDYRAAFRRQLGFSSERSGIRRMGSKPGLNTVPSGLSSALRALSYSGSAQPPYLSSSQ